MFETLFNNYKRIIFFDTETTGFEPKDEDQMIELAAVSIDDDGKEIEMDEFIRLFKKPQLPEKITQLTGITNLDLAMKGIDEYDALRKFVEMMQPEGYTGEKDILLVAHNAQFDLRFITYSIYRNREKGKGWMMLLKTADYLDTLTIYKDRRNYPHKLENAIAAYGLTGKVENSHRAIDDCKALLEVAKKMDEEKPDLDKYINLFGFNPKYGPGENQFSKVTYAPQPISRLSRRELYKEVKR